MGLGLALHAATQLPQAHITVFDARPLDRDVSGDPRTLALSLGSVQTLERLGVWSAVSAASCPIHEVHVSQQQPALLWPGSREPVVRMSAAQQGVAQLGAVVSYGQLVAPLQAQWMEQMHAQPQRLFNRFGTSVRGLKPVDGGVEVDADIAQRFDLAVVAEGGVFAQQPPLSWPEGVHRDYHQTAWVGQVVLDRAHTTPCLAFERFTPQG
ncbi:MAG: 2-octaprenyl-6-methoxyphenyl hydroxylase, partial [Rhizobacter sp.]